MKKHEQSAIEAVAKRFSATWEKGGHPPDAYLLVAGKRVAVDFATLERRGAGKGKAARPRLRFDRVATGLLRRLQSALGEAVPDGVIVLLTITAPIRLPAKTAASLEDKIRSLLQRGSLGRVERATLSGNRVRIGLVRHGSKGAPKLMGFVHNPDSDPLLLMNMTREMLELNEAEASRRAPRLSIERWLVVISEKGSVCLEAYRTIYSQLRMGTDAKKVVMVFADGRLGMLAG